MLGSVAKIPADTTVTIGPDNYKQIQLPNDLVELDTIIVDDIYLDKTQERYADTRTGTPVMYYKRGNYVGFYPIPIETATATIQYFKYPDALVIDTDVPNANIPEDYHQAIVDYAKAMQIKDDDPDTEDLTIADNFLTSFYNAKNELKRQANTSDNTPTVIKNVYEGW
jgi:hypothetical protein